MRIRPFLYSALAVALALVAITARAVDIPISSLPAATNASGTDVSVIVQSGTTKKVTLSTLITGLIGSSYFTVAGPTAARTYTFPNADATIARTDSAQTFTGTQTFSSTISGSVDGAAATATTATNATNVATTATTTNSTHYLTFVGASADGNQATKLSTGLTFNPNTNTISTTALTLSGNITAANLATFGTLTAGRIPYTDSSNNVTTVAGLTFDGTSKITLGVAGTSVGSLAVTNATSGSITVSPPTGALGTVTLTLPAATDTLVGKATTDTLTNKRITLRNTGSCAVGDGSSYAIPTDSCDEFIVTGLTQAVTFTTSGTPTTGQKLFISVTGTAARGITWSTGFGTAGSDITHPTTTTTTKALYTGWRYDGSNWRLIAKADGY